MIIRTDDEQDGPMAVAGEVENLMANRRGLYSIVPTLVYSVVRRSKL